MSEPTARKLLDRTFKVTGPNSFTQDPLAAILLVARVEKVLAILKLADCRCGNIDPQKIERILNGESE